MITNELQALLRPGEKIRKGPGGALYLGDGRIFVAKYNPTKQRATVVPFPAAEVGEVRVESGREQPGKPAGWFVEIQVPAQPFTGMPDGDASVEAEYAERPNVVYCGRGPQAQQLAEQIGRALRAAVAPPEPPAPPPPPPPPPPAPPPPAMPADWYPDPQGKARLRYFDGTNWTDHTAD